GRDWGRRGRGRGRRYRNRGGGNLEVGPVGIHGQGSRVIGPRGMDYVLIESEPRIVPVLIATIKIGESIRRRLRDLDVGFERRASRETDPREELHLRVRKRVGVAGAAADVVASVIPCKPDVSRRLIDFQTREKLGVGSSVVVDSD